MTREQLEQLIVEISQAPQYANLPRQRIMEAFGYEVRPHRRSGLIYRNRQGAFIGVPPLGRDFHSVIWIAGEVVRDFNGHPAYVVDASAPEAGIDVLWFTAQGEFRGCHDNLCVAGILGLLAYRAANLSLAEAVQ